MRILTIIIIIISFCNVSCEYNSKIVLSESLPLKISTEDKALIKRVNLFYKDSNQMTINILDSLLAPSASVINFAKNKDSAKIIKFIPYIEYSLYINTDRGKGYTLFHVDKTNHIIVN
jgi:hypothetical protein